MSEPNQKVPGTTSPAGGEQRRLDRAPAERYAGSEPVPGGGADAPRSSRPAARPIIAAVLIADAGALVFFVLGLLDLGPGLVAVAAFIGWATALALVWRGRDAGITDGRTRVAIATFLGCWAIVAGITVDWLYALGQGGVLGPVDYVVQRYGIVAIAAILVAGGVAAYRAR